ncbi:MAG: hypothetical protein WC441_05245 [Patescibacteria group bacterium]
MRVAEKFLSATRNGRKETMDFTTMFGMVGSAKLAPRETTNKDGKPFRRFTMFVDDPAGRVMKDETGKEIMVNGYPRRHKKAVQVIVEGRDDSPTVKAFRRLEAGMRVSVMGHLTTRAEATQIREGNSTDGMRVTRCSCGKEFVAYANPTFHPIRIDLLDAPLSVQANRVLEILTEEKAISQDEATKFLQVIASKLERRGPKVSEEKAEGEGSAE